MARSWNIMVLGVMAIITALAPSPAPLGAQGTPLPRETVPLCDYPSHDRLTIQSARDVCSATLNRAGQPVARGFLPTRCPDARPVYRIDAWGKADRCAPEATASSK